MCYSEGRLSLLCVTVRVQYRYYMSQEEIASLRRKVERAKKIEQASSADDVLMEEIREYKVEN